VKKNEFLSRMGADAPGVGTVAIVQHDTNDMSEPIRSLVVFAAGDVKFRSLNGTEDTWTIPEAAVPYTIPVAMVRVYDTGTTVADADMRGIL
jgi:hypothetical protein